MRNVALTMAGAAFAPVAWVAGHVLANPVLAHAIAAPRRVLASSSLGRISYYEDDAASGLPVVLLHDVGPAGSSYELHGIFDAVRAQRPVIAADLPGYGFSERRAQRYTRDDYIAFVGELLADVARRYGSTLDVVAVGTTGELAAAAVARSPRHVRSLAIVGPTGFERPASVTRSLARKAFELSARATRPIISRGVLGAVVHRFFTSEPLLRMTLSRRSFGALDEGLVRYANAASHLPRAKYAPLAALGGGLADSRLAAHAYESLSIPLCFVHGTENDVVREAIDSFVSGHAGLRRLEVRGARGMPHLERTLETASALQTFWRSLAVKPQLRIIRGERAPRGLGGGRRSGLRNPARRAPIR